MNRLLGILLAGMALYGADLRTLERDLDEIGRTASVMVDGDICERIVTPRAVEHMLHPDPRDQWADGDNYDVDDQAFVQTKKTLMRLARLAGYPVDVNLWMTVPKQPSLIHVVIRNRYEMSQFWVWGKLTQPMFPEMRKVLETGQRLTIKTKPGFVSVLAPVRNSMDSIVGLVEVVSRTTPDPRENVK